MAISKTHKEVLKGTVLLISLIIVQYVYVKIRLIFTHQKRMTIDLRNVNGYWDLHPWFSWKSKQRPETI